MQAPKLSIVLLTLNEEKNISACLRSLAHQQRRDFEVIVVDASSTDKTVELVRAAQKKYHIPLRIQVAKRRVAIGEARNHGVKLARAPFVAFVSADAELHPAWTEEAMRSLGAYDLVFGLQLHSPHKWTLGAAVRGLRYHFPQDVPANPLPYASNVAAAYKKEILELLPFDAWANATEDLLLAERAVASGFRPTYNPRMVVRHHDVANAGQEFRKIVREGHGWGAYADELGLFGPAVAWGSALLLAIALLLLLPSEATLLLLVAVLWMPALKRALMRRHAMPLPQILMGAVASPIFDFAFLASYVGGLASRDRRQRAAQAPEAGA